MARERVERCVGLSFKDVAEELLDKQSGTTAQNSPFNDSKQRRAEFARQYLEKLINIEVPVPVLDKVQSGQFIADNVREFRDDHENAANVWQYVGALKALYWYLALPVLVVWLIVIGFNFGTELPQSAPET